MSNLIIPNNYQDEYLIGHYEYIDYDPYTSSVIKKLRDIGITEKYDYRPPPFLIINGMAIPEGIASKQVTEWLLAGHVVKNHPRTYIIRIDGAPSYFSEPSDFYTLVWFDGKFLYSLAYNPISQNSQWGIYSKTDGDVYLGLCNWARNVWDFSHCQIVTCQHVIP